MSFLDELSKALIREVESECAEHDPDEIGESAAMVMVGDVYALQVCQGSGPVEQPKAEDMLPTDSGVFPFIR